MTKEVVIIIIIFLSDGAMHFLFCLYRKREIRCARIHLTQTLFGLPPSYSTIHCRIPRRTGRRKLGVRFYFGLHFTVHHISSPGLSLWYCTVLYGTVYMCLCSCLGILLCFALLLYCFLPLLLHFIRAEHTISTDKRGFLIPLILPGYLLPVRKYESTYLLFPLLFPKVLLFPSCLRRKRLIDLAGPISRLDPRAVYLAPSRAGRP